MRIRWDVVLVILGLLAMFYCIMYVGDGAHGWTLR